MISHEQRAAEFLDQVKREQGVQGQLDHCRTASDYATLIFYWAFEPHPELMDEMLAFIVNSGMIDKPGYEALRVAGVVTALQELNPERGRIWEQNYPYLFQRINEAMRMPDDFNGWSDFLVCKWFILRKDEQILQLLDRAGQWGEKCKYTAQLISNTAKSHGPFRYRAEQLRVVPKVELVSGVQ